MKRCVIYIIIFILTLFVMSLCSSGYFFSFYYTTEEGDDHYHSKVSENILILNYGKNIKSIDYCFTNQKSCNDYLSYEKDLSKRILNVSIDYPDNDEGMRICVRIKSSKSVSVHCSGDTYVVDSYEPVVNSLYNEVIMMENKEELEELFEVSSNTGIKDFSCNYDEEKSLIECKAVGNNTLTTTYTKKVYVSNNHKLEGKKILFAGDSITAAKSKFDSYSGFAGRVGISNYMDWVNSGVNGATITEGKNSVTDQIKDHKEEDYDYIILQGGINDMHKDKKLGEISEGFEKYEFDDKTFVGGLEKLFYYTKKYNPDSKIGFIITYETPNYDWGDKVTNRDEQNKLIKEVCEKWEIPYLDLYDGVVYDNGKIISYSDLLKVDSGEYFYKNNPKEVHLETDGYNIISKYISAWINTL